MRVKKFRHLLRIGTVRGHAQMERPDAAQNQPGVERTDHAAEVANHLVDQFVDIGFRTDHGAPHGVAVPAQVLRGRVDCHRRAQPERLLEGRAGEGVIDHGGNAARAPKVRQRPDVEHLEDGIRGRLEVDQTCVGPEGLLKILRPRRGDEGGRSVHARQLAIEKVVSGAVERSGRHHVVARFDVAQNRGRDRRHSRGERQGRFSSLDRFKLFFECANRRVAVPRVHVPGFLLPVDRGHLIGAGGNERGGLVDGRVERAGRRAGRLSGMNGQGRELVSVFHFAPRLCA